MTEDMRKWPWQMAFRTQGKEKLGHRMAAEKILFPRRWSRRMMSTNLELIWEIPAQRGQCTGETGGRTSCAYGAVAGRFGR
jgi:hypothetical protein